MRDINFERLAAAIPEPMLLVTDEGDILCANPPAARICGTTPELLRGQALSAVTSAAKGTPLEEYLALCARSRQPVLGGVQLCGSGQTVAMRCEGVLLKPRINGTAARILLRWRPRQEAGGRFVLLNEKIAALNHEIMQRKHSEDLLHEKEEWLRVTLSSIGDAVIATDCEGKVTFMNAVAESLTGWPQAEAAGRSLSEVFNIVNEQTRAVVENPCQKVIQTGKIVGLANHTILISRDSVERPIEDSAAPIRDDRGTIRGVVLVFHDVSESKQYQREREQLLLAERAARADAERMNRLKDEFLATLSHELRTPLNAIVGWAQILRGPTVKADDLSQGLETIARNARVQARLIEDLLDMSRIISGKLRLDIQRLEPIPVLRAAIDAVRPAAEAKSITLIERLDSDVTFLIGDPNRLQQIAWNLLSNAIKFTPKHGQVEIVLKQVHSQVEITVRDTGQGIAPEFLPYLFERFRQADASATRHHGGLGLGLSIVKHLVELHGGLVHASSPGEGQGAEFTVRLPIRAVSREPLGPADAVLGSSSLQTKGQVDLNGVRVLVVDDEPDARLLVRRLLEDCGATVVTADSVRSALEVFRGQRPDLVLSDIGLPDQDGYHLIRSIRQAESSDGRPTPAVALTAFARTDDRTKALLAGYQVHLAKPVDAEELIAVAASLTGRTLPLE